jgi:hypothetical protein
LPSIFRRSVGQASPSPASTFTPGFDVMGDDALIGYPGPYDCVQKLVDGFLRRRSLRPALERAVHAENAGSWRCRFVVLSHARCRATRTMTTETTVAVVTQ